MNKRIQEISNIIPLMENHLCNELLLKDGILQEKKVWENTFIKKQIEKRNNGGAFSINDHIRAMVYSMLSSGIAWDRVEKEIDLETGKIKSIDEIFNQYNPNFLLQCNPSVLRDKLKELHCASQYTQKQMTALIEINIPKLMEIESKFGYIDTFYQKFICTDESLKTLILLLSDSQSKYKFTQLGVALVAEYLRNVGYDISKPDRHIQRILGKSVLGCSVAETVPVFEAMEIVTELAKQTNKSVAHVDYILWSYCSNGYGEICTVKKPQCHKCVARNYCNNLSI